MESPEYIVRILDIKPVTHDVKFFRIEKPAGYTFNPGQATDVSVNKSGWLQEKRPFTFTCLNDENYLEFTIKGYPAHHGVTELLHSLNIGDELIIRDVWGAIEYKGPGYFIAGGAGITPFIAILRDLNNKGQLRDNKLIFANRSAADIIYREELSAMLGDNFINVLSRENNHAYEYGRIDDAFIKKHIANFGAHFYTCGPDQMIADINKILTDNGASPEKVVFEK